MDGNAICYGSGAFASLSPPCRRTVHSPAGRAVVRNALIAAIAIALPAPVALAAPVQVAMMQGAQPCVALTFDDGPDPVLTPKLLTILEEKDAKATFFVVGLRAVNSPDVVVRADRDG